MEIKIHQKDTFFEVIIETGNAQFKEDVAEYDTRRGWFIDEKTIRQCIALANEMSRFNSESDIDFVKNIADAFLNDSEKNQLIAYLDRPF